MVFVGEKQMQLEPIVRMMVREAALGLSDEEIALNHPEYTAEQVGKVRRGTTFQKAIQEMQVKIDEELITHAAEDSVRKYLRSKGLCMAQELVAIAVDDEQSGAARVNAINSALDRGGFGKQQEEGAAIPVLMLSPAKLAAVLDRPDVLSDIPDCVDNELAE